MTSDTAAPVTCLSTSPPVTERLGASLGALLRPGDLVLLSGPYGAGKTCFTRGIARGAGVRDRRCVTSPTFVLMNVYEGRVRLFHVDCHRLERAEAVDLGVGDALAGGAVVIEWGERMPPRLAESAVTVDIRLVGRSRRRLRVVAVGARGVEILEALRNKLKRRRVKRERR